MNWGVAARGPGAIVAPGTGGPGGMPVSSLSMGPAVLRLLPPGTYVEAKLPPSSAGSLETRATGVMQVLLTAPPDEQGSLLEARFLGASEAQYSSMLCGLFSGNGAGGLVHICSQANCSAMHETRPLLHLTELRIRDPSSLTEPWLAHAVSGPFQSSAHAFPPVPLGPPPICAPSTGAAVAPGPLDPSEEGKQEKKIRELKKRLASARNPSAQLFERAQRRRTGGDEESEDDKGASRPFGEAPSLTDGNRIRAMADTAPGTLLDAGLAQVRRFLTARGGASASEADRLAPMMVTYLRSVWQGAHPPATVGPRTNHEMELLAQALDNLLRGELPELGDLLMQRFKSLQVGVTSGWRLGEQLELIDKTDLSLAGSDELHEAVRSRLRTQRPEEGMTRAKASS